MARNDATPITANTAHAQIFGMGQRLTIGQARASEWPTPKYVLGPLQPGDVAELAGADGLGKTWVAEGAGISVAQGKSLLGGMFDVPAGHGGKVLYLAVEDRRDDHGRRLKSLAQHIQAHDGLYIGEDDERLIVLPLEGKRLPLVRRTTARPSASLYEVTTEGRAWAEVRYARSFTTSAPALSLSRKSAQVCIMAVRSSRYLVRLYARPSGSRTACASCISMTSTR